MFYCECNQHSQNQITSSRLTRFSHVNAPFYGTNKKSSAKVQWNIKRHFYTVYSKSGTRSKSDYISCRLRTPPVFCLIPVTHSFTWKDFMVREFFKMSIFVISLRVYRVSTSAARKSPTSWRAAKEKCGKFPGGEHKSSCSDSKVCKLEKSQTSWRDEKVFNSQKGITDSCTIITRDEVRKRN